MFVHREEYFHHGDEKDQYEGQAEVIIAKQRNGPVGTVELRWEKEFTRFQNLAPERLQEFDDYSREVAYADADADAPTLEPASMENVTMIVADEFDPYPEVELNLAMLADFPEVGLCLAVRPEQTGSAELDSLLREAARSGVPVIAWLLLSEEDGYWSNEENFQQSNEVAYAFVDWVEADLLERLGPDLLYQGGLTIETTIDPRQQAEAEEAVAARLTNTEYPVEMSLVSLEPETGHVVAMVGGRDYEASQVNLATGGSTGFQPGSSFKPIVMAAAFELGLGPDTVYQAPASWTVPSCSGSQCTLSNYDHAGHGSITLREAMRLSVNTVFAQLVMDVTIGDTVELGRQLGLERLDPDRTYGASLALGAAESSTLEMASAYGTFANRGVRVTPTGIVRVIDAAGNVLIDNRNPAGEVVVDPVVADNVTDVLVDVINRGTGKRARLDRPAAGKTGTAQNYRAAWFVGYTPNLATAVWMGHADHLESLRGINGVRAVTGGSHPAIAWRQYMDAALEGTEVVAFPEPEPIVAVAKTSSEIVELRRPEETEVGRRSTTGTLSSDCGGQDCERYLVQPWPDLPPPTVPEPVTTPTSGDPATSVPVSPDPTVVGASPSDPSHNPPSILTTAPSEP